MKELREYQKEALRVLGRSTSGLLADDRGLGKTLVAVERVRQIAKNGPPRVLVIAPLNTVPSWIRTFEGQYPSLSSDLKNEEAKAYIYRVSTLESDPDSWDRMFSMKPGVFIIGWEAARVHGFQTMDSMRKAWRQTGEWDLIIADEVHKLQNHKSQTAQLLKVIKAKHRLAMSATPAGYHPKGLWSVGDWIWPTRFGNYWSWLHRHMEIEIKYARGGRKFENVLGEKIPGSAFKELPCVVRRSAEDVKLELPEVVETVIHARMSIDQNKIYRSLEERAFAWLGNQPLGTPLPIEQRARLRQVALAEPRLAYRNVTSRKKLRNFVVNLNKSKDFPEPWLRKVPSAEKRYVQMAPEQKEYVHLWFPEKLTSNKTEALVSILEDLPQGEPVLVLTHSKRLVETVTKRLEQDYDVAAWTGNTTPKQREKILDTFGKSHGPKILCAVTSAIGEGTDGLQNYCATEVWLSQDDYGLYNFQAEGRLHRSGQKRTVNRFYIRSEDTIDERVYMNYTDRTRDMSRFYRDI